MRKLITTFGITSALVAAFVAGAFLGGTPVEAAKTFMSSTPMTLVPDEGPARSLALVYAGTPGWVEVQLYDEDGVHRATPIRFKMTDSGQRIAADFPGCDSNYVVTDAQGHIIDG